MPKRISSRRRVDVLKASADVITLYEILNKLFLPVPESKVPTTWFTRRCICRV